MEVNQKETVMEYNRLLKEAEGDLDIALGSLENAFIKLASIGFIENPSSELLGSDEVDRAYSRIDFSAIVSLRNLILEELGEI